MLGFREGDALKEATHVRLYPRFPLASVPALRRFEMTVPAWAVIMLLSWGFGARVACSSECGRRDGCPFGPRCRPATRINIFFGPPGARRPEEQVSFIL